MTELLRQAQALQEDCRRYRRTLHQNPELSFQEYETTAFIRAELEAAGIEILPLKLETGLVAVIRGEGGDGPVTALRADIDALPLQEKSGAPYASRHPGAAHSCGHDGHAAILLGTARLLQRLRERLRGTVKLIFQPGEEGLYGAMKIIESGALKNPDVEEVVCLHGWPYLMAGQVGVWPGEYMASADMFQVRIIGRGGHGARPYKAVNPIPAAALAVSALQNITASEIVTAKQAVVSVCSIHAGKAFNVIPDQACFGGTVRCLDPEVRDELEARVRRTVEGAAQTLGCRAEIDYTRGVPALYNDPGVARSIEEAAVRALGEESLRPLDGPVMGSEDFSNLVNAVGRGAFFRLGIGRADGSEYPALHSPMFDFNDDAIPAGIAVMAQYILNRHGGARPEPAPKAPR